MNANKPTNNDAESLHRINRLTSDADWSIDELRTELVNEGVNPDKLLSQVKNVISQYSPNLQMTAEAVEETGQKKVTFAGILATAKKLGINNVQLANLTGLSIVLIAQLDRGLIKVNDKLPFELTKRIADAINVTTDQILGNLGLGPRFAPGANYKSEDAPQLPEAQDFPDAVRDDPTLLPEQRERLLAMVANSHK